MFIVEGTEVMADTAEQAVEVFIQAEKPNTADMNVFSVRRMSNGWRAEYYTRNPDGSVVLMSKIRFDVEGYEVKAETAALAATKWAQENRVDEGLVLTVTSSDGAQSRFEAQTCTPDQYYVIPK